MTFYSSAPLETDLALAARRAVASMSTEWLTLKAAISMTTPLIECACILIFPLTFIRPRWNITRARFPCQGGGLAVFGTATLANTNVYNNHAANDDHTV